MSRSALHPPQETRPQTPPAPPRGVFAHFLRHPSRLPLTPLLIAGIIVSSFPPLRLEAGDILRGGATTSSGRKNATARANAGSDAAAAAQTRAQDRLARTTKAVNDMRSLQAAARAAAGDGGVPNGLITGGLDPIPEGEDNFRWEGANAPIANGNDVTITQNLQQAILHWRSFNVGKNTRVNFDQSAGGNDVGKWIAFNKIYDPSGKPSQIRGQIKADGQVYIINQNGIIFGAGSQVNARSLTASSLPINDNLVERGLLNQNAGAAEFLFSASGTSGEVIVESGAELTSPITPEGSGGRVALVGPSVANRGAISAPNGQVILAAGLEVGFDASTNPSLRGLTTFIGSVESDDNPNGGTAINSGLISIPTASLTMAGRKIEQTGVVDSTTTVALNGRIDLLADYDAVVNQDFNPGTSAAFLHRSTGSVTLGSDSVTRILPDYASTATTVGTTLPLKSEVNIRGRAIYLAANSALQAPNGNVRLLAGTWNTVTTTGSGSSLVGTRTVQDFVFPEGQVYLDPGSLIDVSGSTSVFIPLDQSLVSVQLRGNELAPSPLQRDGNIRGIDLTVDLRRTGTYAGRFWIGTPLGDATGFANIIERNVAQLTATGGSVTIQAGGSFVSRATSIIDVSGGTLINEGGQIQTTRLRSGAQILDIASATPDVLYDGVFDGRTSRSSPKWGVAENFAVPLASLGGYSSESFVSGADSGSLSITAPAMAIDGELLGRTTVGPRQLQKTATTSELPTFASLKLNFIQQVVADDATGAPRAFTFAPTPPEIELGSTVAQTSPGVFDPDDIATLPQDRIDRVSLPEDFYSITGFGSLNIENSEGRFAITPEAQIEIPSTGSLTVAARRIQIGGSIRAPGGKVDFTAYNLARYQTIFALTSPLPEAPVVDPLDGTITLSPTSTVDVSGHIIDNRITTSTPSDLTPFVTNGGEIRLVGHSVFLPTGSRLDASGGATINSRGRISFGNGGSITVLAGQDPAFASILGGQLALAGTLRGFSGRTGASLSIKAPFIQVGGNPIHPDALLLSPQFFSEGGFSSFNLTGLGGNIAEPTTFDPQDPDAPTPFLPAVFIAPGVEITPIAQTLAYSPSQPGQGQPVFTVEVRETGLRSPVSLSFSATSVRNQFVIPDLGLDGQPGGALLRRGDIVVSQGARIALDPGASLSFRGDTVSLAGRLEAPGGTVTVAGASAFPLSSAEVTANVIPARPTVYLAPTALISASGAAVLTPDSFGRKTGRILPGGTIRVSGNIVAEAGSLLDVSGTSESFDVHPSRIGIGSENQVPVTSGVTTPLYRTAVVRQQTDSDGGLIELVGADMLFTDATLIGRAGGPTAVGGRLAVSSGRPSPGLVQLGSDINLTVSQSDATIPAQKTRLGIGRPVRDAEGVLTPQRGYFAADRFQSGGFASLDLGLASGNDQLARGGNVEFVGPVSISAPGALRLASGGIILADAPVNLNASYIFVGQSFRPPENPNDALASPFWPFQRFDNGTTSQESVLPFAGSGSIAFSARLIDVGTLVFRNTTQASFTAENGDIRGNGNLNIAGDLTLSAAQIYPTTFSAFNIFAYDHTNPGSITITQAGRSGAPFSAAGSLNIFASNIFQGGVLAAPFGSIRIGWDSNDLDPSTAAFDAPINPTTGPGAIPISQNVVLQSGSVTTVAGVDFQSGSPLLIPFGASPDGLSIIDPRGVNVTTTDLKEKTVIVSGDLVTTEVGSTVDLRGGGDLLATRFVSGPGGQINLLSESSREWTATQSFEAGTLVSFRGQTWSARTAINPTNFANSQSPAPTVGLLWSLVPDSYAVLPGYGAPFAPISPFNQGSNAAALSGDPGYVSNSLRVGDQVFLDGGSGLPAGTYTLLPRAYANIPGAFLVTPQSSGRSSTYQVPEGATYVTGTRHNAFVAPTTANTVRSVFEVAPPTVVADRAAYDVVAVSPFLQAAAVRLGVEQLQRLPSDSAYLQVHGNTGLRMAGGVLGRPTGSGRGARVDISTFADLTILGDAQFSDGPAVLNAATLSGFGAEDLLIGGVRTFSSTGTSVTVRTSNLTLNNAGTPLSAPEVTLVSQRNLTLEGGSELVAAGGRTETGQSLAVTGEGTLVRVSTDSSTLIARSEFTDSATAPLLTIRDGARISGSGVLLDSSAGFQIEPGARIQADSLSLAAGQIGLFLNGSTTLTGQITPQQLVLSGATLADIQQSRSLTLLSYRNPIDFYGPGDFGSDRLEQLVLLGPEIRGFDHGGSSVNLRAGSITIANQRNTSFTGPALTTTGSITAAANQIAFGNGNVRLAGYADAVLTATRGVIVEGIGSFTAQGNLIFNTPVIAVAQGAKQNLVALGALDVFASGSASVVGGTGGSLSLRGTRATILSDVLAPSGQIEIRATGAGGDVTIGGKIDTSGVDVFFYDLVRSVSGGRVQLTSDFGNVLLTSSSTISVAAAALGGNAGSVAVRAEAGLFSSLGQFNGQGNDVGSGGSFSLDTLQLASLDILRDVLNAGGFSESRDLRVRTGNLVVNGSSIVRNYRLVADAGDITVAGTIDASGVTGGSIALVARGNLVLQTGSFLTVHAQEFNSAGKGGEIFLEAGASVGGAANLAGSLTMQAGSTLELGVDGFAQGTADPLLEPNGSFTDPTSSAFQGQFRGTLHLRAPQIAGNTDAAVNALLGTITGASSVLVEAYRVYSVPSGNLNIALRNQIQTDGIAFLGAAGTDSANAIALRNKLITGTPNAGLGSRLVLAPGAEFVNTTGDLRLGTATNGSASTNVETTTAADWDLSTFRYGASRAPGVLTLRAAGNIFFNNALSDGFDSVISSSLNGNSRLWLGNLQVIDLDAGQTRRPINVQSWSYRITAGADFASASSHATLDLAQLDALARGGSVFVGEFYAPVPSSLESAPSPAIGSLGLTANNIRMSTDSTDRGTRYEVIRTGTGSIDVNAGRDVQLRNSFASIFSAGVRLPNPENLFGIGDFRPPELPASTAGDPTATSALGAPQQIYGPAFNFGSGTRRIGQYSMSGGNIAIAAGQDIGRYTRVDVLGVPTIVKDSSRQLPNNWLNRRGFVEPSTGTFGAIAVGTINDTSASTTWWIDYSNFFEGVGALGGGDVDLTAGRDVVNVDAFAPTNARMAGRDALGNIAPDASLLLELGGGDVTVTARNNIDGGVYYVERGRGTLTAGGEITTNEARSPSFGYLRNASTRDDADAASWLPTTLFLGKGSFDVTASGNVLLGPVVNAFLLPQGLTNKMWYKTYFNTYQDDSSVNVASIQGSVTHRMSVVNSGGATVSPLTNWLTTQNLFVPGTSTSSPGSSAFFQPWIRLTETSVGEFETVAGILPPQLRSTSFGGDINLVGSINLFPSSSGTLELAASGNINGLQQVGIGTLGQRLFSYSTINISDADSARLFSTTTPQSYFGFVSPERRTALNLSRSDDAGFLLPYSDSFTESGSFVGDQAAISRKNARHASPVLHRASTSPVRVYAAGGDVSGLTLFTPKFTQIAARSNVTDVALYLQNANADSISIVSAGRDVTPYNASSRSRNSALGLIGATGTVPGALAGDIQISGPGILEVLAGRDIDLGTANRFSDGTGAGITSIGRSRNPFLPFNGARIIVVPGVAARDGSAALGLRNSELRIDEFINQNILGALPVPTDLLSRELTDDISRFAAYSPERQAVVAIDLFYSMLRQAGNEFTETGSAVSGYEAISFLFGDSPRSGNLFTRTRDIRTTSGGAITIAAPGGDITMAPTLPSSSLTPPGIVTEFGGFVDVFLNGDLSIGATRIFTLRGGDLTIWSSEGDIAAGTSPKTVVSAPPTRVSIDGRSASVETDLGGLATGGGIGVLAAVSTVTPGSVALIAPLGTVDAGDAGIRATGDISIAAAAVVNADNIAAGGTSTGVPSTPTTAAPNVAGLTSGSTSTAAASSAADQVAEQARSQPTEADETPSIITVEVLGYGGGEDESDG